MVKHTTSQKLERHWNRLLSRLLKWEMNFSLWDKGSKIIYSMFASMLVPELRKIAGLGFPQLVYHFMRNHKSVQPIITWSKFISEVEKDIFVDLWCYSNMFVVVDDLPCQNHDLANQGSALYDSFNYQTICALQKLISALLFAICIRKNWGLCWLHSLWGSKGTVAFFFSLSLNSFTELEKLLVRVLSNM